MCSVTTLGVTCELSDLDAEVDSGRLKLTGEDHLSLTDQDHVAPTDREAVNQDKAIHAGFDCDGARNAPFAYTAEASLVERWRRRRMARMTRRGKQFNIAFTEFADLSDSRRYVLRNDRGFSRSSPRWRNPWLGQTPEVLAADIRHCFSEYEKDRPTAPEWVAERLRRVYGINVDPVSVEAALRAPLLIEFGPQLLEVLPKSD